MAALPKSMEHVSRRELYTSLPARVQYLQQFLEFGPGMAPTRTANGLLLIPLAL